MRVLLTFETPEEKQLLAQFVDTSGDSFAAQVLDVGTLRRLGILLRLSPSPATIEAGNAVSAERLKRRNEMLEKRKGKKA